MRFDGKAVIVTGGASGIGLAAARRFGTLGARVTVAQVARGPAPLPSRCVRLGP